MIRWRVEKPTNEVVNYNWMAPILVVCHTDVTEALVLNKTVEKKKRYLEQLEFGNKENEIIL